MFKLKHIHLRAMRYVTTRIRKIRGAVLILDLFRHFFYSSKDCVTVTDFDDSLTVSLCLNEHMQSQIFWYGYYNRDIVSTIKNFLHPNMVVVDLGSNIGEITLVCAKIVGTSGRVIAFEPMSAMVECLLANVNRNNFQNVIIEQKGISDTEGVVDIFRAPDKGHDGAMNEGLGTLFTTSRRSELVGQINVTTLDKYFSEHPVDRLDLIKIDIEGAELAALRGAVNTIKTYRPHLIIEVQEETSRVAGYEQEEILSFLSSLDYKFYSIGRKGRLDPLEEDGLLNFQNVFCNPVKN